ncbi:MAG TPA: TonB-dependent receptor [Noviherbaspirillum sp.]|uniref:TonB-dependent receptor plug domain-containing protein n=1 Tax=Noviherbaspirillum sp. TaxID=1926288 RepID=UPI002B4675F7|nr:TonB-dependent receptor [Noviherbaspirillum sp.]HJV84049.1 TonB-dependent receptor [Noviherbaspirillum sp.]
MPIQFACFPSSPPLRRIGLCCACAVTMAGTTTARAASSEFDLAALPIEQLLTLEVYSASKFVQKLSDAPSAVEVVTAADIKTFGWRTLADILRSMRGLYVTNDRNYSYLGARGFLRPGDYNTRFLLLVDGVRNNDAVYDQASIGSEFMLDVDLIERVEFVPGPGSSIYGANAFFGVINIITKRGRDLDGAQAAVQGGTHGAGKLRASYGKRSENGAEWLLSASTFNDPGADLYFREFDTPATHNGIAHRLDYDRGNSVFVKGTMGPFSLSASHAERTKGVPTASFSQVFNDPRSHTVDAQSVADIGYRATLADATEVSSRVYAGRYDYTGDYIYDYPPLTVNRDGGRARWWGAEAKMMVTRYTGHKLVAGAEYQRDYRRDQFNTNVDPYAMYLDDHRHGTRSGIYLQDEVTLRENLLLNAGLRYDRMSSTGGTVNPRLALIFRPLPATTFKALYGTAFRAPNAYEMYYQVLNTGGQKPNPDLKAEHIRTYELVAEQQLAADARVTASVFRNIVSNLITQTMDPADGLLVFRNLSRATARGIEFGVEKAWSGGMRLRSSYSWQQTRDDLTGAPLVNSPHHLAKLNLSAPVFSSGWRAGVEGQYVGRRKTLQSETGGYWLANLTLSSVRLAPGLEMSASIYNLFDRAYADPGAEEHVQDVLRQDGRSFRLKMTYAF